MREDYNTGNRNTRNRNTGNRNTGNRNTGDFNTGDWNTGDCNTGHFNTGHFNTGHPNTGHYNAGNYNTGNWNTGHGNTGHENTGHGNTGDWNTGNWNTGDWNTGSRHVGCFNTQGAEKAYYFNKLIPVAEWEKAYKPRWLYTPSATSWVFSKDMTAEEKKAHPEHETTGGYLRVNDLKEEWRKAYDAASPEDREAVKNLPGFDADVFLEITGIDLRETVNSPDDEIILNGVRYRRVD